ncbi:phosphonate metabolism transcriptional regulator PhnF [Roseibium sp. RKSG952]|uniref:phosphonate metabolism transcriptional regulator PhnF n=1 Tax=Roseibium sp. RKSG952 TaxID=2529384 RepID=UPI0012BBE2FF|nr:phosphonate metabolism transcriptional regulator PhnF [Roseibium sp. RKSG952]MTH98185.1 phosphonate metabolism transcriptional regulator PhnF [Roseibium sp. RKSG952]
MTRHLPLDRGAGIAIWRQIMEWLKAEIASGAFATGSRLPPESEIADQFGVNRHTVRRAIAELSSEGILRADQGRGTFVATTPLSYPIGTRTRFSDIMSEQNQTPEGRLLGSSLEPADALRAKCLEVPAGTPLIRLETLRIAGGVPVIAGTSWFEERRFPALVSDYAETGSVTKAMARAGVTDYTRKESRVSAALVSEEDAGHLELAPGSPVLLVDSVNVDGFGKPVHCSRSRMASGRMQLVIES